MSLVIRGVNASSPSLPSSLHVIIESKSPGYWFISHKTDSVISSVHLMMMIFIRCTHSGGHCGCVAIIWGKWRWFFSRSPTTDDISNKTLHKWMEQEERRRRGWSIAYWSSSFSWVCLGAAEDDAPLRWSRFICADAEKNLLLHTWCEGRRKVSAGTRGILWNSINQHTKIPLPPSIFRAPLQSSH